jgi:hypothetical protein
MFRCQPAIVFRRRGPFGAAASCASLGAPWRAPTRRTRRGSQAASSMVLTLTIPGRDQGSRLERRAALEMFPCLHRHSKRLWLTLVYLRLFALRLRCSNTPRPGNLPKLDSRRTCPGARFRGGPHPRGEQDEVQHSCDQQCRIGDMKDAWNAWGASLFQQSPSEATIKLECPRFNSQFVNKIAF